jgi:hypothetical protein
MRVRQIGSLSLVAGLVVTLLALSAGQGWAAEKGTFRGLAVLVMTKFNEIKTPEGHPKKALWQGEQEGLVFNEGGILDKALYTVQFEGDGGSQTGVCYKTFTTAPNDKVFARCEWKLVSGVSTGTLTLLGGTGRYAGIKGSGKFKVVNVSDKVAWDLLEWDYELPGPLAATGTSPAPPSTSGAAATSGAQPGASPK